VSVLDFILGRQEAGLRKQGYITPPASASDNFNSGITHWTTQQGTVWNINSNGLAGGTGSTECSAYYKDQILAANQFATAKIVAAGPSCQAGVSVRCTGTGASTKFYGYYGGSNVGSELFKVVNGVKTSLQTGGANFAANDIVRIEVSGTSITCKRNGATTLTTTDSDVTGAGYGGAPFYSNDASYIDDWSAGDL
jgi:hypothetical protein